MKITRRELIVLAGAAALGGCAQESGEMGPAFTRGPVDAGTTSDYPHEGIYDHFRNSHGFFVVRQGNRLFAESSICTHRACKLEARGDGLLCPCHGSVFTLEGHVTRGPARRDLPHFAIERDAQSHLIVHTDRFLWLDQRNTPAGFVVIE